MIPKNLLSRQSTLIFTDRFFFPPFFHFSLLPFSWSFLILKAIVVRLRSPGTPTPNRIWPGMTSITERHPETISGKLMLVMSLLTPKAASTLERRTISPQPLITHKDYRAASPMKWSIRFPPALIPYPLQVPPFPLPADRGVSWSPPKPAAIGGHRRLPPGSRSIPGPG